MSQELDFIDRARLNAGITALEQLTKRVMEDPLGPTLTPLEKPGRTNVMSINPWGFCDPCRETLTGLWTKKCAQVLTDRLRPSLDASTTLSLAQAFVELARRDVDKDCVCGPCSYANEIMAWERVRELRHRLPFVFKS